MKKLLTQAAFIALVLCFSSCGGRPSDDGGEVAQGTQEPGKSGAESAWYSDWIADELAEGASFHSEFPLAAGAVHLIPLETDDQVTVGFVVKDGFEVSRSSGSIHLGTPEKPDRGWGSPGIQLPFSPVDGKVEVRLENTSEIDTRIVVYTK